MQDISPSSLRQTGRNLDRTARLPDIFFTVNCDYATPETYRFNFTQINQMAQFGIVETLFVDNGSNPSEIEVTVSGTDQFFTVPAYAQGYFPVSAADSSVMELYSVGGATDIITIGFYNHKISGVVWYQYGSTNNNVPVKTYGPMSPGDIIAAESFNTPVYIGGIDNTGVFRGLLTDNTGAIQIAGVVSLSGSILIDDGDDATQGAMADAAITNPALSASLVSLAKGNLTLLNTQATYLDGIEGLLTTINTNIADIETLQTAANALLTTQNGYLDGIEALIGTTNTNTDSLIKKATAAANSSVAGSAASVTILASNANRRGATVYNDSTAILYLNLDNSVASTTNYTAQLVAGAYYEVPFGYTGEIRGIWASATGNARITEFS